jgi:hypothetical protein
LNGAILHIGQPRPQAPHPKWALRVAIAFVFRRHRQ